MGMQTEGTASVEQFSALSLNNKVHQSGSGSSAGTTLIW